jgi:hypothetical protein
MEGRLAEGVDHAGRGGDRRRGAVADAEDHPGLGEEVPHPVRALAVLGDHVVAAVARGEPDLDLVRPAGAPAGRGQVQELNLSLAATIAR